MPPDRLSGVPSFNSVDAAIEALRRKDNFEPSDLYPRDGTKELASLERRVGDLVGVAPTEVLLYNSGMASVVEAIELGFPTSGDFIAHSTQLYSQTGRYFESLRERGIKPVAFDSGDLESVESVLEKRKPKILFAETVSNAPGMRVLDVDGLLSIPAVREVDHLIVLDNTMPTPTIEPLGETLDAVKGRRVVVVESGTKSYALNGELLGIVYTKNPELLDLLRRRRRMNGSLPGLSTVTSVDNLLPSKEVFDLRNKTIAANTKMFAEILARRINGKSDFFVTHPNLAGHQNAEYVGRKFPDGASQVMFLLCQGEQSQYDLARALWENRYIQDFCDLGQSFGFDRTRIWPDSGFPTVRIACGTESTDITVNLAVECANAILSSFSS